MLITLTILLVSQDALPIEKIKSMEDVYQFNSSTNCEILYRWIRLCIQSRWEPIIPLAIKFITQQGRMKFVRPIYRYVTVEKYLHETITSIVITLSYRALYAWEYSRNLAIKTFLDHRHEMMYLTAHCVAKELHLEGV